MAMFPGGHALRTSATAAKAISKRNNSAAWAMFRALEARYSRGELITLDGATGTELTKRGVDSDKQWNGWPAQLFEPDLVQEVHADYVRSGCDILTANTYGTNRHVMGIKGFDTGWESVRDANTRGVRVCKEAAQSVPRSAGEQRVLVAGSMSNHPPAIVAAAKDTALDFSSQQARTTTTSCCGGHRTQSRESEDDVREHNPTSMGQWPEPSVELGNYREQARYLQQAGVDLIFLEMVKDVVHGDRIVQAAVETGLPVVIGMTLDVKTGGAVVARDAPDVTVGELISRWGAYENVVGFSAMHCSADDTAAMVREIRQNWSHFVGAYPNQGVFVPPDWNVEEPLSAAEFLGLAKEWVAAGANAVGGCCGFAPEHIAAFSQFAGEHNNLVRAQHLILQQQEWELHQNISAGTSTVGQPRQQAVSSI